jgi:hypothetical protein
VSIDENPTTKHRPDGFSKQEQEPPGLTNRVNPRPHHGEETYIGHERLVGKRG